MSYKYFKLKKTKRFSIKLEYVTSPIGTYYSDYEARPHFY